MDDELILVIKKLTEKISEIEERLSQLESGKIILEERKIPSKEGELEGRTYFSTSTGGVIKEIRIGVCDICGRKSDEFDICVSCKRKLCKECSIIYENQVYCKDCLYEKLPINKEEYKVLLYISRGFEDVEDIINATNLRKETVLSCIKSLSDKGYIQISSFLFFSDINVLDSGFEALKTYSKVYAKDEPFQISLYGEKE